MSVGKVIVIGNEKGGTGKSTLAMHLIVWFLRQGKRVASVDLDGRQGTLTHYIENRAAYAEKHNIALGLPEHLTVAVREFPTASEREEDEVAFLYQIEKLKNENDVIIVDTAGADSALFRLAHSAADVLMTPINDSLIDLAAKTGDAKTPANQMVRRPQPHHARFDPQRKSDLEAFDRVGEANQLYAFKRFGRTNHFPRTVFERADFAGFRRRQSPAETDGEHAGGAAGAAQHSARHRRKNGLTPKRFLDRRTGIQHSVTKRILFFDSLIFWEEK